MSENKYIVLVIYDIVDNKRRSQMVKALEAYGLRVQKSAFEAMLTKKQYETMLNRINPIIDQTTDSLRVYILNSLVNVYTWGVGESKTDDCVII